ncbi:MAG: family 78 glycoside hydrolase catalytic domain [Candidatus Howiella sp.]|jgi:alpha-L-rhamnosidase
MLKQAKWIKCRQECETPIIKKTFSLDSPKSGTIDISGLGFFELHINGKRVSEDYLVPAFSDYQERNLSGLLYPIHDTLSHRIYYMQYDISRFLQDGENTFEVILGNGWYRQKERTVEGKLWFGEELKAIFSAEITLTSGGSVTVNSDGTEVYSPYHITYSNLYIGEVHDARLSGNQGEPRRVEIDTKTRSELIKQTCPPDRIVRTITPRLIKDTGTLKIYDAGENISGWVRLRAAGKAGDKIILRFSEELTAECTLDFESAGGSCLCADGKNQVQSDVFICDGNEREFEPKFVFHGFRYFDVQGDAENLSVMVVNSDVPCSSEFGCDNEALNWLYDAYIRTELANMHSGVPSDCPHRERLGYTGDGQITADSAMLTLDSERFFEKWIYDITDCQDVNGGHIQHTAPFMGGGGGPAVWGGAVVAVPYAHYKHFGNTDLLKSCYPNMKKWVGYMKAHSENYLVLSEEKDGWCLGDWAAIGDMTISEPFVNTCFFIKCLHMMKKIAVILGESRDAVEYEEYTSRAGQAVTAKYYDEKSGSFCGGAQAADAFALDIGLDNDPRTLKNLVEKYEALGYFDTGFAGTDILVDVLIRRGCVNTAFRLLTSDKKGSYLWMKRQGATTLWEYFNGFASHCHPMFGAPVRQLFYAFLGIRQTEDSVGFQKIIISPVIPDGLNYAKGKITTKYGEIAVSWRKDNSRLCMDTSVPQGTDCTVRFNGETKKLLSGENRFIFVL